MSGNARKKSSTGIYHVMLRGNNKQTIFHTAEDYDHFLSLLNEKRKKNSLILYAWCLMPNHVHLLIKEKDETLADIFRSMLSSFIKWYNAKYQRVGHIFQGRYESQPVEDQTYFLRVFRYIHRNPLEANLCGNLEAYRFSSYAYYFRSGRYQDHDMILNLMQKDDLERYHMAKDENEVDFLDIDRVKVPSEEEIVNSVLRTGFVNDIAHVNLLPRDLRTRILQMMLNAGISYRRIHELTGVSLSIIRAMSRDLHKASGAHEAHEVGSLAAAKPAQRSSCSAYKSGEARTLQSRPTALLCVPTTQTITLPTDMATSIGNIVAAQQCSSAVPASLHQQS